jgi:hypothetical protein
MHRPPRRFTNFVTDRPLFDAVRRATGICLSSDEVFALLETGERDQILSAAKAYDSGTPSAATAYVDGHLAPVLSARADKESSIKHGVPSQSQRLQLPQSNKTHAPALRTKERVPSESKMLVVEAVASLHGEPTLEIYSHSLGQVSSTGERTGVSRFQFKRDELALFAATLLGLVTKSSFGASQGNPCQLEVGHVGVELAIRLAPPLHPGYFLLTPARAFHLSTLATRQLALATGHSCDSVFTHLRATIGRVPSIERSANHSPKQHPLPFV